MYCFLTIYGCFCASGARFLDEGIVPAAKVEALFEELRKKAPAISVYHDSYHFETRTRTVNSTDANGQMTTRTETYQAHVSTLTGSEPWSYDVALDRTRKPGPFLRKSPGMVRLSVGMAVEVGDDYSAEW
jgi:hypothetical protein